MRNSRGHFNGVVVATLEASFFDKALMLFGGETGTQCLLMNLDGDILNLVPYSDSIGKNLQGEIAYTEHIASGKPSTRHLNVIKLEHTLKMLVFQNLQEAPLAVVASRDYDSVTADWRRSMYVHAAIFLALAATILLLLRLSVRNHRSLILSRRDLAEREIKLRTIIEAEPECVKLLAPDGTLLGMNRAGLDMIEADSEAQVIGTKVIELITPEYRQAFADLSEHVNRGESGTLEFEIVGLKGGRRWLETHAVPMRDNEGGIVGLLGVTRDITVQKNTLAELEHLVQTDELTKLASRRHFFAQAELELSRAKRYAASPSVLMLDIDHFKRINDTYGHEAGDVVLRTLGELCRGTLRDVDIAGRLGGEEFAVMLPETGREAALAVAERLRQTIADVKVSLEGGFPIRFTASIGVASFTEEHPNLDTLLSQADKALYEAKKAGRNRVWMFDPDKE